MKKLKKRPVVSASKKLKKLMKPKLGVVIIDFAMIASRPGQPNLKILVLFVRKNSTKSRIKTPN